MKSPVKRITYLVLCLLSFSAFLLEYLALGIEILLLRFDPSDYAPAQEITHHILTAVLWAVFLLVVLCCSRKHCAFPAKNGNEKISSADWLIAVLCLLGCKIITFIDWHTLKVIGEFSGKTPLQFCAQYLYYFVEVALVLLIIQFGQKAAEVKLGKESAVPFGGMAAALTWGMFHFVSGGVGIEWWNGISCMLFSVLSGIMYLRLRKNYIYSYFFIAIGYLL